MSVDVRNAASNGTAKAASIREREPIEREFGFLFGSLEDVSFVPRLCPTRSNRTIPNVTKRNGRFSKSAAFVEQIVEQLWNRTP